MNLKRFVPPNVPGARGLTSAVAPAAAQFITRVVLAVVMVMALMGGMAAQAAITGGVYSATGTVVAVTPESNTLVVQSTLKGDPTWLIGAQVTERTVFTGRATGLQDLRPGDRISLVWVRLEDGDIAHSISLR